MIFDNLNPRFEQYSGGPPSENRHWSTLVLDTVSSEATAVSGIFVGSVEAMTVAIVDGSGNQITSFAGGTQYTDGGTPPAHPLGPTLLWDNGGTWEHVSAAEPLPVEVQGFTGTNVVITDNPINLGVQAVSAENTPVTASRKVQLVAGLEGKLIILPYANKENYLSNSASATGTSATQVLAAQGTGLFLYITAISVVNTGSTTSLVTIQWDTASALTTAWILINPAGGGDNITFPNALRAPVANKNVGFTCGGNSTTQYVSISGYFGT